MTSQSTEKQRNLMILAPCAGNAFYKPLKQYVNIVSIDFKAFMPILTVNRTRQGYARKRILKLAGHFFSGVCLAPSV